MIDIIVSFFPRKDYNVRWGSTHRKTLTTWTCDITQSMDEGGVCDNFIPFGYFPARDPVLTCEAHELSYEKGIGKICKHTIHNRDIHKDLAKAMNSATEFMKDLKQFIMIWVDHYSSACFHSKIEIKNGNVSFAKGKDLVTF